jgi:hypothetical protein
MRSAQQFTERNFILWFVKSTCHIYVLVLYIVHTQFPNFAALLHVSFRWGSACWPSTVHRCLKYFPKTLFGLSCVRPGIDSRTCCCNRNNWQSAVTGQIKLLRFPSSDKLRPEFVGLVSLDSSAVSETLRHIKRKVIPAPDLTAGRSGIVSQVVASTAVHFKQLEQSGKRRTQRRILTVLLFGSSACLIEMIQRAS